MLAAGGGGLVMVMEEEEGGWWRECHRGQKLKELSGKHWSEAFV